MTAQITDRLERWRAFVGGEGTDRYMFHVNFPLLERETETLARPHLWPDKVNERIEWAWSTYEVMCRKAALVDDDRVPCLNNATGTEIFAEAFGCPVHRPDDNIPFALPLVQSAAEADALRKPELSGSSLAYLFDIADELYRRGGPESVMKPVDIQSPMDIVALIWDKSDLFMAMIESPESVKALAEKVRLLMVDFFSEWFRRYGTTFVSHFPDYVMHGGITMSVDEVGAVSEEMFDEFFRPELISLADTFGGLGIHCCADARHQWKNFKALPGLKVMNHVRPPTRGAEYLTDSMRFYGDTFVQAPGWVPDCAPETWPDHLPEGTRIAFEAQAKDVAEAASLAARLQERRDDSITDAKVKVLSLCAMKCRARSAAGATPSG